MIHEPRSSHLLARRIEQRRVAIRHLAVSVALLVVALVVGEVARGTLHPLAVGALLATVLFAVLTVLAGGAISQVAIDTVAAGDARIVAELAPSELCALTSRKTRETLASTLALCLHPAPVHKVDILRTARAHVRREPPLRPQIEDVIHLLGRNESSPVGVALVHQLITEAGSPLYSGTPQDLGRRLGGISHVLAAANGDVRDGQSCSDVVAAVLRRP
jgi:hypothetical protein